MKRTVLLLIAITLLSSAYAQTDDHQPAWETEKPKTEVPKWISDKGYWVVESNKQTPTNATIYFYTMEHQMVYKETMTNNKLKLSNKKVLMRLKAALEEAVASYEKGVWANQNQIVAQHLQR